MPPKSERFELRLDESQLSQIDKWAEDQANRSLSRAAAIRELIDIGLAAGSKGSVRFSDGEKVLMLMMQDISKAVKVKDPDINANFVAEVIYGGHYWAPKWDMPGVFHDHVDSEKDVRHVTDVLDMWTFMEEAYESFDSEKKEAITAAVGPWATNVKFAGFDGNNESSQLGIARFLINDMDRFSRFKGRDLNSHHPTFGRYQQMVKLFEPIRQTLIGQGLNVAQIVTLLKA